MVSVADVELAPATTNRTALFIAVPALCILAFFAMPPLTGLDDGYIALHSAQVLLSGHDPVFGVPALIGSTSTPHVAMLAAVLAAHVPPLIALRLVSGLGFAAMLGGTWWLSDRLPLAQRACMAAIVGSAFHAHAANGLETGWAIAVGVFALSAAVHNQPSLTAAACGLLAALRPDLGPVSLAIVLSTAYGRRLATVARMALIAGVTFAPLGLIRSGGRVDYAA
jgi:hypothetical protein